MDFVSKMMDFVADMMEVGVTAGTASHQTVPDDELRINNDGICIRNDGFCIRNDGFCVQNDEFRKGADAMHDCGENGTDICQPLTVAEARVSRTNRSTRPK